MRRNCIGILFSVCVLLVCFAASPVNAQNARGTILGHVQDPSGAPVPNAKVTVENVGTGISNTFSTTSTGDFVFVNLIPGTYNVKVEANGFKATSSAGLIVQVDQTLRQDFTLQVGELTQQVTVSAASQMVQTDNATIGQVITQRQIQALPLSGQDFTSLVAVNAGVTQAVGGIQTSIFAPHGLNTQFRELSVDGARAGSISYIIDGITDTDFFFSKPDNVPPADAIQEFKLQNGLYPAEYGFGSAQVNVALKSGTNQLHGGAYDFIENSVFQPNNPINSYLNSTQNLSLPTNPHFTQNLFGVFAGGPVILPKIYHGRNRTFWFFSYEGGRKSQTGGASLLQVPTQAERGGNFSDWPYPIYDPSTTGSVAPTSSDPSGRTQFPGNQIPSGDFNSIGLNLLNYFPLPNITCTMPCTNYAASLGSPTNTDVYTAHFDHLLSPKDQISFSLNAGREQQLFNSPLPASGSEQLDHSYLLGLQYQRTFTPNAIGVFHMGYNRENFHEGAQSAFGPNLSSQLGFSNVPNIPAFYGIPNIGLRSDYTNPGQGNNGYSEKDNVYQYSGDFTYVHGAHTFHIGTDIRRIQLWNVDGFSVNGSLNFTGAYTASDPIAGATGVPGPTSGNAFGDLLLGDPLSVGAPAPLGSDNYNVRGTQYGFYFEDDYRITPRLTLNLGARYEIAFTPHSINNSGSVLTFKPAGGGLIWADQSFVNSFSGPANIMGTYFQCCVTNKLVPGQGFNWRPRIGFAWRPFQTTRFVVRGGYGIFGDLYNRFYDGTNYDSNQLFVTAPNPNYPPASGGETVSPLNLSTLWLPPITVNPTSGFPLPWQFGVQTQWPLNQNPYMQQWSLDTQYALTPTMLLDVGYVGSHGLFQPIQNFFNQANLPTTPDIITTSSGPVICNSLHDASQATGNFAGCPATGSAFQPIDTRVPFPNFSAGSYANANVLMSHYNALQVRLDQRFSNGLTFLANYTWSRSLDESSEIAAFGGASNFVVQSRNLRFDYGPSSYNQTHRLVLSYVYDFPVGKGDRWSFGPANWILGNWETSGVVTLASGTPFTVFCCSRGNQTDLTGNPFGDRLRAQASGSPTTGFTQSVQKWFNTSVFSLPAYGTYGNTGRNILNGPMMRQGNISFMKSFPIAKERQSLQYRLDIYNVFSSWHNGQYLPDSRLGDPSFGSLVPLTGPTAALGETNLWTPRVIEMALRYTF